MVVKIITGIVLVVLGLGVAMVGNWVKNREGKENPVAKGLMVGGIAIIAGSAMLTVFSIAGAGIMPSMGGSILGASVGAGTSAPIVIQLAPADEAALEGCGTGDRGVTPQPVFNLQNKYTNAIITEATNILRLVKDAQGNDIKGAWSTFTSGTAISVNVVSPGDTVEVVYGITTTDNIANAYGPYVQYKIQCKESPKYYALGANDENAAGMSSTFLNNLKAAAAVSPIAASQQYKFYAWLNPASKEVFGNPYMTDENGDAVTMPNQIILSLNSSQWDSIDELWIEEAPGTCKRADGVTPCTGEILIDNTYSNANHTRNYGGSNLTEVRDFYPMANGETWVIGFKATTGSGWVTAVDGNDVLFVYSGNYFTYDANAGSKANEVAYGIEDRLKALVGQTAPEMLAMDFT